jgi:NAD(P)-dependent dehydrogenase (short-subunit alcohol dehydrogenase family)
VCAPIESCDYPLADESDLAETVRLVENSGGSIVARIGDVRSRADITAALDAGYEAFGRLDSVVANAGICPIYGEPADGVQAFSDAIEVMLTGAFNTVDLATEYIIDGNRGGSIVFTSSVMGLHSIGLPREAVRRGWVGYMAAKHGLVGLMRHYATVLGPHRIRSNSVHPTAVTTPMIQNDAMARLMDEFPPVATSFTHALPVGAVEAIDVARAVSWLVSEEARYITGVTMPVDAGFLIR